MLCLFLGLGKGVSILVSQYEGTHDEDRIRELCHTAISFVYLCGIPAGIIGILCTPAILRFMNVPADAFAPALT